MEDIAKNLEEIRKRIDRAAAGREVTLVAVTKLHSPEEIQAAIDCGVTEAGENKVQELLGKIDQVGPVNWHLIGHLQTNKVRQIVGKAVLIHSVDSLHLAEEINRRAAAAGIVQNVLIQVNAAGEEQKSGAPAEEVPELLENMLALPNLRVQGLMQIAPFAEDPEDVRRYFRQVKRLYDDLKTPDFRYLSMGMSHDFETAIEEGANMVRIGTAIFGARDYGKE